MAQDGTKIPVANEWFKKPITQDNLQLPVDVKIAPAVQQSKDKQAKANVQKLVDYKGYTKKDAQKAVKYGTATKDLKDIDMTEYRAAMHPDYTPDMSPAQKMALSYDGTLRGRLFRGSNMLTTGEGTVPLANELITFPVKSAMNLSMDANNRYFDPNKPVIDKVANFATDITGVMPDLIPATARGVDRFSTSVANHPLVSTIPDVIKNKAYKDYGMALTMNAADVVTDVTNKIPPLNKLYKKGVEKMASYSASFNRDTEDIFNALFKKNESPYTGNFDNTINRNLVRQYIYGDQPGFEPSDVPTQGLDKYYQKYGDIKNYQMDTFTPKGVPVNSSDVLLSHEFGDALGHEFKYGENEFEFLKNALKQKGEIPYPSQSNRIGDDNIAGHMKFLKYDPVKDAFSVKHQDIWKFTPEDYATKWGNNYNTRNPADVSAILKKKALYHQARMMEKSGKPFILTDERPMIFPEQPKKFEYPDTEVDPDFFKNGGTIQDKGQLKKLDQLINFTNMQEAKSGIHIKPSKKGTFTAAASKHGKGVQEFARQVMANKSNYSPAMVKKANFAHVFHV